MIAYNLFQTLLSLWLFQKASYFWLTGRYNWLCQPVDYSNSEEGMLAADMTWWFFFSKLVDTIDSFFFVLRKKWMHLSPSRFPSWYHALYFLVRYQVSLVNNSIFNKTSNSNSINLHTSIDISNSIT